MAVLETRRAVSLLLTPTFVWYVNSNDQPSSTWPPPLVATSHHSSEYQVDHRESTCQLWEERWIRHKVSRAIGAMSRSTVSCRWDSGQLSIASILTKYVRSINIRSNSEEKYPGRRFLFSSQHVHSNSIHSRVDVQNKTQIEPQVA
jgi:hypothetical protein